MNLFGDHPGSLTPPGQIGRRLLTFWKAFGTANRYAGPRNTSGIEFLRGADFEAENRWGFGRPRVFAGQGTGNEARAASTMLIGGG